MRTSLLLALTLCLAATSAVFARSTYTDDLPTSTSTSSPISPPIRVKMEGDASAFHHFGWFQSYKPHPTHPTHLTFALKQQNLDLLHELFHSVSNPLSPSYGQYLSFDEINQLFSPHPDTVSKVIEFLLEYGVDPASIVLDHRNSGFIHVKDIAVEIVEKMLHTKLYVYKHNDSTETYIRSPNHYSLPNGIAEVVDFVGGVNRLHRRKPELHAVPSADVSPTISVKAKQHVQQRHIDTGADGGEYQVTPQFLRQLYNIPATVQTSHVNNSQAVAEFLEEYYSNSDLQLYLQTYNLPASNVSKLIGPNNSTHPGGEASLDIQVIMGLSPNTPTEFWSFAGRRNNNETASDFNQEPFLEWMQTISSTEKVPLVHSVSYDDDENLLSQDFLERVNYEFMKAAVRGITLLFASGDDGIGGVNVRREGSNNCTQAVPAFPSSSPYITSVGGTQLDQNTSSYEVVSDASTGSRITTGGGFSRIFSQDEAPYQLDSTAAYFSAAAHLPPSGFFRKDGRAYPDISAMATNYQIFLNGDVHTIGGTSASTPAVAAVVTLLNDLRLHRNQPPLGFLNYWLYQTAAGHPEAFNDVTEGNNACSANAANCCAFGFEATDGWDAVTGVGTPNYVELAKHV